MSILSPKGLWQATAETVRHVTKHRDLTWAMAKRDFTDRYVGRIFGPFWSIWHSLALMGIFMLKKSVGNKKDRKK